MIVRDRPLKGAWGMTALIFLFMFINFADKAVLGLAAQPLMAELKLSPEQYGLIGSAFFLLFPVSAVLVGFVSNRVAARHSLLAMAILWSLVQLPMLGVVSFQILIASRIVLGIADGPAYPVAMHAVYKWFPDSLRAMPTALIAQGSTAGVILAVPMLNWIIVHYSWHWAFGALGVAGLAWVVLWAWFRPRRHAGRSADRPRIGERPHALSLPAHLPQHRRGLLRGLRHLLGPGARPHLVHLLSGRRAGLQPVGRRQSQRAALGRRRGGRAGWRLDLAAPQDRRLLEPAEPRRLRRRRP